MTNIPEIQHTPWYVTSTTQNLDKHRVLHTIKRIGYDVYVQKQVSTAFTQSATIINMTYSCMDYKNDYTMGTKVYLYGKNWTQWPLQGDDFMRSFFHETIHNIGYSHTGGGNPNKKDNVPYLVGEEMMWLYRSYKDKYATQIQKMQEFYLIKYRSVISAEPKLPDNSTNTGKPRRSH